MNPNPIPHQIEPPIVLLDLNYTLIDNCDDSPELPFKTRIPLHTYRQWLVDLVKPYRVFILTARPDAYRHESLLWILRKTGWEPGRYYGNTHAEPPPLAKERMLRDMLLPEFGTATLEHPSPFLGIESNPRTRTMYAKHLIPSLSCQDLSPSSNLQQVWKSLATGLFATSPSPPLSTGTSASSSPGMTSQPALSRTSPATT